MTIEQIQYAGQVLIDEITLISSDGNKKLDLTLIFREIDLFEDLYSPCMYGSINLNENFNLISNFPILGEEILLIKFHTPTITTAIEKKFVVTAIKDKKILTTHTQGYIMHFISYESYIDLNLKVFRAYSGTPSESATQIFKSYFPNTPVFIEQSSNALKLLGNSLSPFKFLNMLASKAIDTSSYGSPSFLFFEDNQSFNFVSLNTLFKQNPITSLRWSASQMRDTLSDGTTLRNVQEEYQNIKTLYFDTVFNTVDKFLSGSMGHKVYEIDMIRKTVAKRTYNYIDNFGNINHLNPYPTNSQYMIHSNDAFIESCAIHPAAHDNYNQDRDAILLSKRPAILSQNEYIKFDAVVHGRTDIRVGQVIEFQMGTFDTTDPSKLLTQSRVDAHYSGNYMIGAIQHRITLNRHESILQLFKESFNNQIVFK